jgi:hypothetical protein
MISQKQTDFSLKNSSLKFFIDAQLYTFQTYTSMKILRLNVLWLESKGQTEQTKGSTDCLNTRKVLKTFFFKKNEFLNNLLHFDYFVIVYCCCLDFGFCKNGRYMVGMKPRRTITRVGRIYEFELILYFESNWFCWFFSGAVWKNKSKQFIDGNLHTHYVDFLTISFFITKFFSQFFIFSC